MRSRIFAAILALTCLAMAPPSQSYLEPAPFDARAEIADGLYAAPETQAAVDRVADVSVKKERARIDALAIRVHFSDGSRDELTKAEEEFIAALSALDHAYGERIAALRASMSSQQQPPTVASAQLESPAPSASASAGAAPAWDDERGRQARAAELAQARYRADLQAAQAARAVAAGARRRPVDPPKSRSPSAVPPEPEFDQSSRPVTVGAAGGGGGRVIRPPQSVSPIRSATALPNFPWPPPTPSERLNLTRAQVLPASLTRPTLSDVGNHIVGALEAAGYSEYSFYAVPGGFAVVARLERMEADGTPAPQTLRFLAPDAAEPFNFTAYVSRLFFAPEGYYRQIVFVVTTQMVRPAGPAPDAKAAEALLQSGADRLPATFRQIPFTADDQVSALIYEYHKGPQAREVQTLTPGRLDARTNLVRAGLYGRLLVGGN